MRLRADHRQQRQEEALERLAISEAQTPQQRLEVLNERLGAGAGAKKERARLLAKIVFQAGPAVEKSKKTKKAK